MRLFEKRRIPAVVAGVLAVLVLLAGWDFWRSSRRVTDTGFAMGTAVVQRLTGKGSADAAKDSLTAIRALETKELSWRVAGSDIAKINAASGKPVEVSPETVKTLQTIIEISKRSAGALDCTVGNLTRLWDFDSGNAKRPTQAALHEALKSVDYKGIRFSGSTVTLQNPNTKLDLGAVGKGMACDTARQVLKKSRVKSGTVSVGGSVLVFSADGKEEQNIAIRDPLGGTNDAFAILTMTDGVVSTSGSYERYFDVDGVRYHHLLSPATGMPAETGLLSVTVVSDSGLLSDALSTACFVLGYEKGAALLKDYGAKAVFVFTDKTVRATDGLNLKITNPAYQAGS